MEIRNKLIEELILADEVQASVKCITEWGAYLLVDGLLEVKMLNTDFGENKSISSVYEKGNIIPGLIYKKTSKNGSISVMKREKYVDSKIDIVEIEIGKEMIGEIDDITSKEVYVTVNACNDIMCPPPPFELVKGDRVIVRINKFDEEDKTLKGKIQSIIYNEVEKKETDYDIPRFYNIESKTVSENQICLEYQKKIFKRDIRICEILLSNRFLTEEQINDYIIQKGESVVNEARLHKLCERRIINKTKVDGRIVYSLDLGGKYVITNLASRPALNWFSGKNKKSKNIIRKFVKINDVYIDLIKRDVSIEKFIVEPIRRVNGNSLALDFESVIIDNGGSKNYFIGIVVENIESYDLETKLNFIYDYFTSNTWKANAFGVTDSKPICMFISKYEDELMKIKNHIEDAYKLKIEAEYMPFENVSNFMSTFYS